MPEAIDPRRWQALAVLGIAYLMVVLDVSIVNVALPSIQSDLGFAPEA
jgi:MFS family permease